MDALKLGVMAVEALIALYLIIKQGI